MWRCRSSCLAVRTRCCACPCSAFPCCAPSCWACGVLVQRSSRSCALRSSKSSTSRGCTGPCFVLALCMLALMRLRLPCSRCVYPLCMRLLCMLALCALALPMLVLRALAACSCCACPRCAPSCWVWCACAALAYIVRTSFVNVADTTFSAPQRPLMPLKTKLTSPRMTLTLPYNLIRPPPQLPFSPSPSSASPSPVLLQNPLYVYFC